MDDDDYAAPFVEEAVIQRAILKVKRKKELSAVNALRLENFTKGSCAQILHIGLFSGKSPTIKRVHDFIGSGSALTGKHAAKSI